MIELPKDADGREIPLDTEVLYDKNGSRRVVDFFKFYPDTDRWVIAFKDSYSHFSPHNLSITPPDSFEKLEDDLSKIVNHPEKVVCAYFGRERKDCDGCKIENCEGSCSHACLEDIITRIRKLRGED